MENNYKYYKGREAKSGDVFVGANCGTCEILSISDYQILARNIINKQIFDVSSYIDSCDLLSRLDDENNG